MSIDEGVFIVCVKMPHQKSSALPGNLFKSCRLQHLDGANVTGVSSEQQDTIDEAASDAACWIENAMYESGFSRVPKGNSCSRRITARWSRPYGLSHKLNLVDNYQKTITPAHAPHRRAAASSVSLDGSLLALRYPCSLFTKLL